MLLISLCWVSASADDFVHVIISLLGVLDSFFISTGKERKFVWILTAFYMVITNAFWFLGFIYQAANKNKKITLSQQL